MNLSQRDILRFFSRVREEAECWIWTGTLDKHGYGQFTAAGKTMYAHRVSYWIAHDVVPTGVLLHTCDTPACVRPAHLVDGTQAQNMDDMRAKGRQSEGERHYNTKLTEEIVRDIRARYPGESQRSLAREFGLNQSTVHKIVTRKMWRHIPSAEKE